MNPVNSSIPDGERAETPELAAFYDDIGLADGADENTGTEETRTAAQEVAPVHGYNSYDYGDEIPF